jgi:arylsulfatase B
MGPAEEDERRRPERSPGLPLILRLVRWIPLALGCSTLLVAGRSDLAQSASSPPPTQQAKTAAPLPGNILILVADDLGADQLALYGGSDFPPTPVLDRMATEGVLFLNAWSQPTCAPTRATLQTGRFGFRTTIGSTINANGGGPGLPPGEVTLPEMLDRGTGHRYAHALIGKWHLGTSQVGGDSAPNLAGYGHFAGSVEGQLARYFHWRKVVDGAVSLSTRYATTVCVDDALEWIGKQSGPWMCVVCFQSPHAPFHVPPPALYTEVLPRVEPPDSCANARGKSQRPFYKAAVQALDTEIGRLLAGLSPAESARTTVLFLGDNGSESCVLASPSAGAKGSLYEGGIHVPLIASGHGVARGACPALVNTADVFATVAELAGVDLATALPDVTLDSVSFAPCLADPKLELREWNFAEEFSENGPGQPAALPPCPSEPVCQEDIGYDGPGNVVLSSCGPPLYGALGSNLIPWQVTGGPPHANAWMRISALQPAFDANIGAWVASSTPAFTLPFSLDDNGSYSTATWTSETTRELHYQVLVRDPSQARGFQVTNALRMKLLPTHMQAVRDRRYKLIRSDPCHEELYDLILDPSERKDLLQGTPGPEIVATRQSLAARLDALH